MITFSKRACVNFWGFSEDLCIYAINYTMKRHSNGQPKAGPAQWASLTCGEKPAQCSFPLRKTLWDKMCVHNGYNLVVKNPVPISSKYSNFTRPNGSCPKYIIPISRLCGTSSQCICATYSRLCSLVGSGRAASRVRAVPNTRSYSFAIASGDLTTPSISRTSGRNQSVHFSFPSDRQSRQRSLVSTNAVFTLNSCRNI